MKKFNQLCESILIENKLEDVDNKLKQMLSDEDRATVMAYFNTLKENTLDESVQSEALKILATLGISLGAATANAKEIPLSVYIDKINSLSVDSKKAKPLQSLPSGKLTIKDFKAPPAMTGNTIANVITLINDTPELSNLVYKGGKWDSRISPEVLVTLACEVGAEHNNSKERENVFKVIKGRIGNKGFDQGRAKSTRDVVLMVDGAKAFSFWGDVKNSNFNIFNSYDKLKAKYTSDKNFAKSIKDSIEVQKIDYTPTANSPVFYETLGSAKKWKAANPTGINRFTSKYFLAKPVAIEGSPHVFYSITPKPKKK